MKSQNPEQSNQSKSDTRPESVISQRICKEFAIDPATIIELSDWIDNELSKVEAKFESFTTSKSRRRSYGR